MRRRRLLALTVAMAHAPWLASARTGREPLQCVVPAKPGGGFDLTCQLLRDSLPADFGPMSIAYHPGGIGALTYSEMVRGLRPHPRELVAFSSGTLLNLAQGRFGPWRPDRIQWIAGLALDHGVVAVRPDAPWRTLDELLAALRERPASVAFAAGGTIGSQDWMKAALLARAAGVDHRALRVVAFEGGGDAVRALQGGHVQVLCGDAAELSGPSGPQAGVRLLAVLARARLPGALASVPTALERGSDVSWPILRGIYASSDFPASERDALVAQIERVHPTADYQQRVRARGLQPAALTGSALTREVEDQMSRFTDMARQFGVIVRR